jgi:hypothetical protein
MDLGHLDLMLFALSQGQSDHDCWARTEGQGCLWVVCAPEVLSLAIVQI